MLQSFGLLVSGDGDEDEEDGMTEIPDYDGGDAHVLQLLESIGLDAVAVVDALAPLPRSAAGQTGLAEENGTGNSFSRLGRRAGRREFGVTDSFIAVSTEEHHRHHPMDTTATSTAPAGNSLSDGFSLPERIGDIDVAEFRDTVGEHAVYDVRSLFTALSESVGPQEAELYSVQAVRWNLKEHLLTASREAFHGWRQVVEVALHQWLGPQAGMQSSPGTMRGDGLDFGLGGGGGGDGMFGLDRPAVLESYETVMFRLLTALVERCSSDLLSWIHVGDGLSSTALVIMIKLREQAGITNGRPVSRARGLLPKILEAIRANRHRQSVRMGLYALLTHFLGYAATLEKRQMDRFTAGLQQWSHPSSSRSPTGAGLGVLGGGGVEDLFLESSEALRAFQESLHASLLRSGVELLQQLLLDASTGWGAGDPKLRTMAFTLLNTLLSSRVADSGPSPALAGFTVNWMSVLENSGCLPQFTGEIERRLHLISNAVFRPELHNYVHIFQTTNILNCFVRLSLRREGAELLLREEVLLRLAESGLFSHIPPAAAVSAAALAPAGGPRVIGAAPGSSRGWTISDAYADIGSPRQRFFEIFNPVLRLMCNLSTSLPHHPVLHRQILYFLQRVSTGGSSGASASSKKLPSLFRQSLVGESFRRRRAPGRRPEEQLGRSEAEEDEEQSDILDVLLNEAAGLSAVPSVFAQGQYGSSLHDPQFGGGLHSGGPAGMNGAGGGGGGSTVSGAAAAAGGSLVDVKDLASAEWISQLHATRLLLQILLRLYRCLGSASGARGSGPPSPHKRRRRDLGPSGGGGGGLWKDTSEEAMDGIGSVSAGTAAGVTPEERAVFVESLFGLCSGQLNPLLLCLWRQSLLRPQTAVCGGELRSLYLGGGEDDFLGSSTHGGDGAGLQGGLGGRGGRGSRDGRNVLTRPLFGGDGSSRAEDDPGLFLSSSRTGGGGRASAGAAEGSPGAGGLGSEAGLADLVLLDDGWTVRDLVQQTGYLVLQCQLQCVGLGSVGGSGDRMRPVTNLEALLRKLPQLSLRFDGISLAPVYTDEEFSDGPSFSLCVVGLCPSIGWMCCVLKISSADDLLLSFLICRRCWICIIFFPAVSSMASGKEYRKAASTGYSPLLHASLYASRSRHTHTAVPPLHLGLLLNYLSSQGSAAQQLLRMQGNLRTALDVLELQERSRNSGITLTGPADGIWVELRELSKLSGLSVRELTAAMLEYHPSLLDEQLESVNAEAARTCLLSRLRGTIHRTRQAFFGMETALYVLLRHLEWYLVKGVDSLRLIYRHRGGGTATAYGDGISAIGGAGDPSGNRARSSFSKQGRIHLSPVLQLIKETLSLQERLLLSPGSSSSGSGGPAEHPPLTHSNADSVRQHGSRHSRYAGMEKDVFEEDYHEDPAAAAVTHPYGMVPLEEDRSRRRPGRSPAPPTDYQAPFDPNSAWQRIIELGAYGSDSTSAAAAAAALGSGIALGGGVSLDRSEEGLSSEAPILRHRHIVHSFLLIVLQKVERLLVQFE